MKVILVAAAAVLAYAARLLAQHTIAVVEARHLLPRWDLAGHVRAGWMDYHLLVTGQIHRLFWDLWLQGYWPPMLSIYQIPFFLVLGGTWSAALWSSVVAFVLVGVIGSVILWRQWGEDASLSAAIFVALLVSSPYLLAYASVTMTEMFGAFVQLLVVLAYVHYRQRPDAPAARLFALSLTALFFTKYNYFFLLVAPLVLHEWIERTAGTSRVDSALALGRRVLSSTTAILLLLYLAAVVVIQRTGGFDFHALGQRVSVHTIGNSGHVVLYLLILRVWYLHHRRRIDWTRLRAADPRVRPLLVWFVLPVVIWLASPYPNHIRDIANLVVNRPLGEASVTSGVATYLDALRDTYFYSAWILVAVAVTFVLAAARYAHQPPAMQWLILAVPLQLAAIVFHQTRFPRFLLLTVVLLCLVASSEAGRWVSRRSRVAAAVLAAVVLVTGVLGARAAVTQDRFRALAIENYSVNQSLVDAFAAIRPELTPGDRLAFVGEGNELSPALIAWELGPPSGVACFPFPIGGAGGMDVALATKVLLLDQRGTGYAALDLTSYYLAQRDAVRAEVDRGGLALARELPIQDMDVVLRLYDRTGTPSRLASCR